MTLPVSGYRPIYLALVLTVVSLAAGPLAVAQQATVISKPGSVVSDSENQSIKNVSARTIQDVTTRLAEKDFEGRGTATPGGEKAAKYIAERFAALKLKPLGDSGTFLQSVKFIGTEAAAGMAFKVASDNFKYGQDFIVTPPYTTETADVAADIVFVGYGVLNETLKRNDLTNLDLKGKIVFVLGGRPTNVEESAWAANANMQSVIGGMLQRGAAAIVLANIGDKQNNYAVIADYLSRRSVGLADAPVLPFKLPPILAVSDEAAEKIFAGSGTTFAAARKKAEAGETVSQDLSKKGEIALRLKKTEGIGSNVVGVIEGSDPKLKDEAVIFTAHYDAWGIANNGDIYAGAADNALGVGEMMAIAEGISKSTQKPRRSTIFLAITGEEHGLLGSEYWVGHPTWPIEKIAADINFDGVGTDIYGPVKSIVGFGIEYSDLGVTLQNSTAALNLSITPDPVPEEKAFYRSDHYAFVKRGVPAMMIMGVPGGDPAVAIARMKKWLVTDYHHAGDTVKSDWSWDGARTVAITGMLIGLRVSNAEKMPAWLATAPFNHARGFSGKP